MNMPETMECKYVQWWLSCHPSVTLNDVMAVLWKCHGLSNGEMLTLTNSPTSDSFHWKGSEIDNSSNIHLTHQGAVTTCLPYMVPSGSLKGLLRSHSFHLLWSIFILCMFRKKLLSLAKQDYSTKVPSTQKHPSSDFSHWCINVLFHIYDTNDKTLITRM